MKVFVKTNVLTMVGVFALISIHSLLLSFVTILVVFYLFPHELYFATPVYALAAISLFITNYVSPIASKLSRLRDIYLGEVVNRQAVSWMITLSLVTIASLWMWVMFESLYNRYVYLRAIDGALKSIGAAGMALPDPTVLAKAFNAVPDRPEVPFILTRASRLLASDILNPLFSRYSGAFLDGVDKNAITSRFEKLEAKDNLAIGNEEKASLPRLDPIRFLANVALESNTSSGRLWAIDTLTKFRKDDPEVALLLEIWNAPSFDDQHKPEDQVKELKSSLEKLERLLQLGPDAEFSKISFVSGHAFQQGLDTVASLQIAIQSKEGQSDKYNDAIVSNYERIILLRRRLSTATDLVWWEPPGKLFLYYIFLHLGHQTVNIGPEVLKMIDDCPTLKTRLQRMYDAPVFRSFQNPDTWSQGTPVSTAFNGSAGVTQLRDWLKRGW